MAFRCPVLARDTASVNGFCTISVPVPIPVPETASVNTPLEAVVVVSELSENYYQSELLFSEKKSNYYSRVFVEIELELIVSGALCNFFKSGMR